MASVVVFVFSCCLLFILPEFVEAGVFAQTHSTTDPVCMQEAQSPVDIETSHVVLNPAAQSFQCSGLSDIKAVNEELGAKTIQRVLIDTGENVEVKIEGGTVCVEGGGLPERYILEQYHFHWGSDNHRGSEHTLDGHHFPMEVHFVFYADSRGSFQKAFNKPMGIAVFGFFFEISKTDNAFLDEIVNKLPSVRYYGEKTQLDEMSSSSFLYLVDYLIKHNDMTYYRYYGSITSGDHYESVIWTIFKSPLRISERQLNEFRRLYNQEREPLVDNYRRTFPLNDRLIYTNRINGP